MKMTQQSIQYSYQGEERNLFTNIFFIEKKKISVALRKRVKGKISNHDFDTSLCPNHVLQCW